MKAIEKDRTRRYESAAAMADDVARFLNDQPINARPPSILYLTTRFARRHRVAIVTATLTLTSLLGGSLAALWQLQVAMHERDQKVEALIEANSAKQEIEAFASQLTQANGLLASGQAHADAGRWLEALRDYDAAVDCQPNYLRSWEYRAQLFTRMRLWDEAAADYSKALGLGASTDSAQWWGVPTLFLLTGREEDYVAICRQLAEHNGREDQPELQLMRELTVSSRAEHLPSSTPWTHDDLAKYGQAWLVEYEHTDFAERRSEETVHDEFGRMQVEHVLPRPVRYYVAGMAFLRAGRWQDALGELNDHSLSEKWPSSPLRFAPQAIAYARLGEAETAQSLLDQSAEALADISAEYGSFTSAYNSIPWFDLAELFLIHREANQLIAGDREEADLLFSKFRQRALEATRDQ